MPVYLCRCLYVGVLFMSVYYLCQCIIYVGVCRCIIYVGVLFMSVYYLCRCIYAGVFLSVSLCRCIYAGVLFMSVYYLCQYYLCRCMSVYYLCRCIIYVGVFLSVSLFFSLNAFYACFSHLVLRCQKHSVDLFDDEQINWHEVQVKIVWFFQTTRNLATTLMYKQIMHN